MAKKIAVYGGAFSPPHIGHAIAVETLMRNFECDEIWLMPTGNRRDKKISAGGNYRKKMISLMIGEFFQSGSIPRISISSLELNRPDLTTTFETKNILERDYPDSEFYFVIGADIVNDIRPRWARGKELYDSAKFLVLKKFGYAVPKDLPENFQVIENPISGTDISSTFVRSLLSQGKSGMPYITPLVAEYIKKNNLYR